MFVTLCLGMGLLPPEFLHGMKKEGTSSKEGKESDSKLEGRFSSHD